MSDRDLPLIHELPSVPEPASALRALSIWSAPLLLDSSAPLVGVGDYSFLTADPFLSVELGRVEAGVDALGALEQILARYQAPSVPDLPPFQGGAAGLFSYELGRSWERVPRARFDEFQLPDLAVGLYDWVLAWDHRRGRAWIVSHGFPHERYQARRSRAQARIDRVLALLRGESPPPLEPEETPIAGAFSSALYRARGGGGRGGKRRLAAAVSINRRPSTTLASSEMACPLWMGAPAFAVPQETEVVSNFSRDMYLDTVRRAIEYIHAGDVFQVNLSQRLLAPARGSSWRLYEVLRAENPAPFAGYFAWKDWAIATASPERFLRVRGRAVQTRPIKGTRPRLPGGEADLFMSDALRESDKDQAENVMIVDLLRNDLSRVCQPGTIRVPQLCEVEPFETVQHLVSEVCGELEPSRTPFDVLRAAFPGGSVTGAPKIRAQQIIAELEPTVRGPYCGSLAYVGFDGGMDSNILIRTFTIRHGWVQCPVGGGIVADSDPETEYEETWHKAEGMLRALRRVARDPREE